MEDLEPIAGYANKREMLDALYTTEGLTIKEIAKRLGLGSATVERWMRLLEIPRRARGGANTPAKLAWRLHRVDPRLVQELDLRTLARMVDASEAYVYKYLKGVSQQWTSASSVLQQDSNVTQG